MESEAKFIPGTLLVWAWVGLSSPRLMENLCFGVAANCVDSPLRLSVRSQVSGLRSQERVVAICKMLEMPEVRQRS